MTSPLIEIYNKLPLRNCGECGYKTCKDFAKALIRGEKTPYQCPHLEEEIAQELVLILNEAE